MTMMLAKLDQAHHFHPFTDIRPEMNPPLVMVAGEGCVLQDSNGQSYLDGAAGLWCVNVGYGRSEIARAVEEQIRSLAFVQSFNGMTNEPVAKLSARIMAKAPDHIRKVFFGNSGSDAIDSAVKLIWFYNNLLGCSAKKKIIARQRGYHGVTVAGGSLTGLPNVHRLFDLPIDRMLHVSAPDSYHSPERDVASYAAELEELILREGPETIAAFFAEPVMATGGVLTPNKEYYAAIAEVLDRYDVLLVLDEVVTGFGRLGTWFGCQYFDIKPDIICTAKGLTSSYLPMVGEKIWNVMEDKRDTVAVYSHGFTTSGHPAAAAAALANLDIIEREGLVERAGRQGAVLAKRLTESCANHPLVGDIRTCGLLAGIELIEDKASRKKFPDSIAIATRVVQQARNNGLLIRGLVGNVAAFSPPFIVSDEEIDEMISRFVHVLDMVEHDMRSARLNV
jgi:L-2,4-diaminobutyrate transaminase